MSDLPEQASVGNGYTTSSTNYTVYIESGREYMNTLVHINTYCISLISSPGLLFFCHTGMGRLLFMGAT